MRMQNITTVGGTFPVFIPNSVQDGDGFYVSYNDHDTAIYGGVTTALVFGQMQNFHILNGDHRVAYSRLIEAGFDACLDYFKAEMASINKRSEKPPAVSVSSTKDSQMPTQTNISSDADKPKLRGYQQLISDATGETDVAKLEEIEDTMRHIVFHSTLSWQSREQLEQGAREAHEINKAIAEMPKNEVPGG